MTQTNEHARPPVVPTWPLSDPARVSMLLEGSSFPAALWSGAELRFTWLNHAFLDLMDEARPQWDILGMPVRGFLSDAQSAVHFIDVAYTGQVYTVPEYEYRASWGETTYWQLTYLPVPGGLGDPYDVLLVAVDVTETAKAGRASKRAEEDLRRAAELIDITVLSTLEAEDILQRVLIEASEAFEADWGWIAERDGSDWVFRNVHGWPTEMVGLTFRGDELSLPSLAAYERAVVCVAAGEKPSDDHVKLMDRHDISAFVLVPLKSRGEVTGVMGFCWDGDLAISPERRELARKLEVSLSLALENARLYEAERRVTRNLQSAFFTVPASLPGFEFGHLYHSAAGGWMVGGGFYDIVQLDAGRLGVLMGEVASTGAHSAALTALVKSGMRAEALRQPSPGSVMARTDDLVRHGSSGERVGAFFGVLEASSGHLAYCSAGHPAPIVSRPGRVPELLRSEDVALGTGTLRMRPNETIMDTGDLLVLYTSGALNVTNGSGERFGEERFVRAVASAADQPAEVVPESLFLSLFSFSQGRLTDDIAILALRRGELGGESWAQQRLEIESCVA